MDEEPPSAKAEFFMAIAGQISVTIIQLSISRSREFGADATGAQISRRPLSLASALRKLSLGIQQRPLAAMPSHNATAHSIYCETFFRERTRIVV
jgi:heat shock protein HtpX